MGCRLARCAGHRGEDRVLSPELIEAVQIAGRAPRLLIGCDYDGTLAPIVDDPAKAHPLRDAIVGLRGLANLADTHVAVISGRALRDLAVLSRLPDEVHLVGSHGSEFEPDMVGRLDTAQAVLLEEVGLDLRARAQRIPGSSVEIKPSGVTFHYRTADHAVGGAEAAAIRAVWAGRDGIVVRDGKCVVELSVLDANKGMALDHLRHSLGADTVLFIGDDVTDEDAFAVLRGPDVGVKVGDGPTGATYRVANPTDVCEVLARLHEERTAWVFGHRSVPITRHSLLSDQRTLALIDHRARLSWLCQPRADSTAAFAELLGGPTAGAFAIGPQDEPAAAPLQQYLPNSMVVQTQWRTMTLIDYMDVWDERAREPAGRSNLIRMLSGTGIAEIVFAPRPDFGRTPAELVITDEGIVIVGGTHPMMLRCPQLPWRIVTDGAHQRAEATVTLQNEAVVFDLVIGSDSAEMLPSEQERRHRTMEFWDSIAGELHRTMVAPTAVRRSALMLESLRYAPTGSMLAAGTTSLPECIGGVRNWDYRFCWPRDASLSCTALAHLGRITPGLALLDWLVDRVEHATRPDLLRPLYPLSGDDSVPEAALSEMAGYRGSRPVRIGNAAEGQVQLDALGPIADLIACLYYQIGSLPDEHLDLLAQLADVVVEHWRSPDHGIWEIRLARQHNVVSKVMCWLVLDRAIAVASLSRRPTPLAWRRERKAIHADVLENGWNTRCGTFVASYGGTDLDAGLLLLGTTGFLAASDTRFVATLHAIERDLCDGHAVYRYRHEDGLAGGEGGMLICTGWLISALAAVGRVHDAEVWFDRLLASVGPTGLLAEQIDPVSEGALGNVPQAYSHLALINAALALDATLG